MKYFVNATKQPVGWDGLKQGDSTFDNSDAGFKLFQARCLVENNRVLIAIF